MFVLVVAMLAVLGAVESAALEESRFAEGSMADSEGSYFGYKGSCGLLLLVGGGYKGSCGLLLGRVQLVGRGTIVGVQWESATTWSWNYN